MELKFIGIKEEEKLNTILVKSGEAAISFNLTENGALSKKGIPQYRFNPRFKVVTFGVQRGHRPEERGTYVPISAQALHFRRHNPDWILTKIYRPVYELAQDDALAAAILDPEVWLSLEKASYKLSALIAELHEYTSNKYIFAKSSTPRLANNFMNHHPFPFKDRAGSSFTQACEFYHYEQQSWLADNLENIIPVQRIYPQGLSYEIKFKTDRSVFIQVKSERFGSDDLIAQSYFQSNPSCVRVILYKQLHDTTKGAIHCINSNMYDEKMEPYPQINTKELNLLELRNKGDASWKNLKFITMGPSSGTTIKEEILWDLMKIQ